jgi:hypothetical protein
MTRRKWSPAVAVLVCGVSNGQLTPNGHGGHRFRTLEEARKVFPDLDPDRNTERFTWALGNPDDTEMRFETWAANNLYAT